MNDQSIECFTDLKVRNPYHYVWVYFVRSLITLRDEATTAPFHLEATATESRPRFVTGFGALFWGVNVNITASLGAGFWYRFQVQVQVIEIIWKKFKLKDSSMVNKSS